MHGDDLRTGAPGRPPAHVLAMLAEISDQGRLPSERRLAELWSVSRNEVRGRLARLRRAGLVETRRQSGSYLLVCRGGARG
ncbi:GntR family transcriptional regulator [Pseudonocardia sp. NPDC049154]|uniref:GntR family transcriptional regulator n=1 Tax=Pseudonocardia sp. NPDC049154 TaxID=3155501 RepID=UPI00340B26C4